MAIGEIIKANRGKQGLTQKKLGELCGYEGRTAELMVQHWEHGRRPPDLKDLRPLKEALKISFDELIP